MIQVDPIQPQSSLKWGASLTALERKVMREEGSERDAVLQVGGKGGRPPETGKSKEMHSPRDSRKEHRSATPDVSSVRPVLEFCSTELILR